MIKFIDLDLESITEIDDYEAWEIIRQHEDINDFSVIHVGTVSEMNAIYEIEKRPLEPPFVTKDTIAWLKLDRQLRLLTVYHKIKPDT